MRAIVLLGLLFVLVNSLFAQVDRISDNPPYLYYYSDDLRSIVVERADGTDSRILGRGIVEEDVVFTEGPDWSSDATWFAWRIETNNDGYTQTDRAYAVHIDGERTLPLLDDFTCVNNMYWHPTRNILLVHGSIRWDTDCGNTGFPVGTFWLIDADKNILLGTFSINENPDYTPAIYWLEDREMIQFSARVDTYIEEQYMPLYYLITMQFDGTVTMQPMTRDEVYQVFAEMPLDLSSQPEQSLFEFGFPDISIDNIPSSIDNPIIVAYQWNSSEEWLLIGYDFCSAGCANVIGEVSIFNLDTGFHREISDCGGHPSCVGWLTFELE